MARHFLLTSAARGKLSVLKIARLSDEDAYNILHEIRWGCLDKQECPSCGVFRKHHFIKSRCQYRCADKECGHTFSITSGTKFAYHKKSIKDILYAVALFVNGVGGVAALRNSSNIGVEHEPILVFNHKLREALFQARDLTPLKSEVEADGCYFHYYVRPKNKHKHRIDRRLASNMNPNKRAVLALRQRGEKGKGAVRTILEVIKTEGEKDVSALIRKYVEPGATINTDDHTCYTSSNGEYVVKQVNHKEEYSADDGTNENQAESFFARCRNQQAHIHKCDPKYLLYYANEMAWRDDNRRKSFTWQFEDLLKKCLTTGQSKFWSKYWQGNHMTEDTLFAAG